VKLLRQAHGLTLGELSYFIEKSPSTLRRIESGGQVPGANVVGLLSALLDVQLADLYVLVPTLSPDEDDAIVVYDAAPMPQRHLHLVRPPRQGAS
jgi:transcriptional regulator with XRE-family HTH domain